MRVLVRRHLERDALVHGVEAGDAVELGAHDLEDRDLAVGGDREHLLDAVVHLDARGDVERGRGDLGAQRLEHRVAAGDDLGVVVLLRAALRAACGATVRPPCVRPCRLAAGRRVALRRGLALAGGVPRRGPRPSASASCPRGPGAPARRCPPGGPSCPCARRRAACRYCVFMIQDSNVRPSGCLRG